jgi:hypothetical protein
MDGEIFFASQKYFKSWLCTKLGYIQPLRGIVSKADYFSALRVFKN